LAFFVSGFIGDVCCEYVLDEQPGGSIKESYWVKASIYNQILVYLYCKPENNLAYSRLLNKRNEPRAVPVGGRY
jgi:hypothetical protein